MCKYLINVIKFLVNVSYYNMMIFLYFFWVLDDIYMNLNYLLLKMWNYYIFYLGLIFLKKYIYMVLWFVNGCCNEWK